MAKGSHKGSAYERLCAGTLSLWWTQDDDPPNDCIFWRTSGSGARATSRSKMNKRTEGQYGDLAAINPVGKPLLDLITVEIKKGYSRYSLADLLDKSEHAAKQQWEEWISKAIRDSGRAGSFSWMIIAKRDKREALVVMPSSLLLRLCGDDPIKTPILNLGPRMRLMIEINGKEMIVYGMHFSKFLEMFKPKRVFEVLKDLGRLWRK